MTGNMSKKGVQTWLRSSTYIYLINQGVSRKKLVSPNTMFFDKTKTRICLKQEYKSVQAGVQGETAGVEQSL